MNIMFTENDLKQIAARGISEEQVRQQLEQIAEGFPFLKLESAASVQKGIVAPDVEERNAYVRAWQEYKD